MSNITVSEVNSAPAWLIAVNLLLSGVLLASVASFDNILSFIILSTKAVHKTLHNLHLPPVPGDESLIKISLRGVDVA